MKLVYFSDSMNNFSSFITKYIGIMVKTEIWEIIH